MAKSFIDNFVILTDNDRWILINKTKNLPFFITIEDYQVTGYIDIPVFKNNIFKFNNYDFLHLPKSKHISYKIKTNLYISE